MAHDFAKNPPTDRDKLRERLQGMSNKDLREFGKACEHGCSKKGASGEPPGKDFMIQLELAREEWKRRMK
jgi:hypothetical protein